MNFRLEESSTSLSLTKHHLYWSFYGSWSSGSRWPSLEFSISGWPQELNEGILPGSESLYMNLVDVCFCGIPVPNWLHSSFCLSWICSLSVAERSVSIQGPAAQFPPTLRTASHFHSILKQVYSSAFLSPSSSSAISINNTPSVHVPQISPRFIAHMCICDSAPTKVMTDKSKLNNL